MIKLFEEFSHIRTVTDLVMDGSIEDITARIIELLVQNIDEYIWVVGERENTTIHFTAGVTTSRTSEFWYRAFLPLQVNKSKIEFTLDDTEFRFISEDVSFDKMKKLLHELKKLSLNKAQEGDNNPETWYKYFDLIEEAYKPKLAEYLVKWKNIYHISNEWIEEHKSYTRSKSLLWDFTNEDFHAGYNIYQQEDTDELMNIYIDDKGIYHGKILVDEEYLKNDIDEFFSNRLENMILKGEIVENKELKKSFTTELFVKDPSYCMSQLVAYNNQFYNCILPYSSFIPEYLTKELREKNFDIMRKYIADRVVKILEDHPYIYHEDANFFNKISWLKDNIPSWLKRADDTNLLGMKNESDEYDSLSDNKEALIDYLSEILKSKIDYAIKESYTAYKNDALKTIVTMLFQIDTIEHGVKYTFNRSIINDLVHAVLDNFVDGTMEIPASVRLPGSPVGLTRNTLLTKLMKIKDDYIVELENKCKKAITNLLEEDPTRYSECLELLDKLKNEDSDRDLLEFLPDWLKRGKSIGLMDLKQESLSDWLNMSSDEYDSLSDDNKEALIDYLTINLKKQIDSRLRNTYSILKGDLKYKSGNDEFKNAVANLFHIWTIKYSKSNDDNSRRINGIVNEICEDFPVEIHYVMKKVKNDYIDQLEKEFQQIILDAIEKEPALYNKFVELIDLVKFDGEEPDNIYDFLPDWLKRGSSLGLMGLKQEGFKEDYLKSHCINIKDVISQFLLDNGVFFTRFYIDPRILPDEKGTYWIYISFSKNYSSDVVIPDNSDEEIAAIMTAMKPYLNKKLKDLHFYTGKRLKRWDGQHTNPLGMTLKEHTRHYAIAFKPGKWINRTSDTGLMDLKQESLSSYLMTEKKKSSYNVGDIVVIRNEFQGKIEIGQVTKCDSKDYEFYTIYYANRNAMATQNFVASTKYGDSPFIIDYIDPDDEQSMNSFVKEYPEYLNQLLIFLTDEQKEKNNYLLRGIETNLWNLKQEGLSSWLNLK